MVGGRSYGGRVDPAFLMDFKYNELAFALYFFLYSREQAGTASLIVSLSELKSL